MRPRKNSSWTVFGTLAVLATSSGCYSYTQTRPDAVSPGDGVRVLVTREGAVELAEVTEVRWESPTFDGTVVGLEDSDLLLSVPVGERQVGFLSSDLNQTIRVPTAEIVSFQRRSLDPIATGFSIAGAVGLGTALVLYIVSEHRSGNGGTPPPPPDDLMMGFNIFSFSLGR